jgi:hypothetical protein
VAVDVHCDLDRGRVCGGAKRRPRDDLAGRYLVVWLSPEAIETFLGVPGPTHETAMTTWTVAGQVGGEAGSGLSLLVKRVLMPDGGEMPLHQDPVYDGPAARRAAGGHSADRVGGR